MYIYKYLVAKPKTMTTKFKIWLLGQSCLEMAVRAARPESLQLATVKVRFESCPTPLSACSESYYRVRYSRIEPWVRRPQIFPDPTPARDTDESKVRPVRSSGNRARSRISFGPLHILTDIIRLETILMSGRWKRTRTVDDDSGAVMGPARAAVVHRSHATCDDDFASLALDITTEQRTALEAYMRDYFPSELPNTPGSEEDDDALEFVSDDDSDYNPDASESGSTGDSDTEVDAADGSGNGEVRGQGAGVA